MQRLQEKRVAEAVVDRTGNRVRAADRSRRGGRAAGENRRARIRSRLCRRVADAGADTFVAGSAIFGKPDYKAVIDAMRVELGTSG